MEEENLFDEYLISKKIDFTKYKLENPKVYKELAMQFEQMHEASFTAQKLFLINPIRRKFPLQPK